MPFVAPLELNTDLLVKYFLNYGIATLVLFVSSSIIFDRLANWRPVLNLRYFISHIIKQPPYSELTVMGEIVCWAFYIATYVMALIFSISCIVELKPVIIGIDSLLLIVPSLIVLLCAMNFTKNGFNLTKIAKITLLICFTIFFSLSIAHGYIGKHRTWCSQAIFASWPSLFVFSFCTFFGRERVPKDQVEQIIDSKGSKDFFVNMANEENVKSWAKNSHFWKISRDVLTILVSGVLNGLFIAFNYKEKLEETLSTGIFSIVLDMLLIIYQYIIKKDESPIPMAVAIFIMKLVNCYFGRGYVIAHCVQFLTLGFYMLIEALYSLLQVFFSKTAPFEDKNKVESNVYNSLAQFRLSKSLFGFKVAIYPISLIIVLIIDMYVTDMKNVIIATYNEIDLTFKTLVTIILITECFFALVIAMARIDHNFGAARSVNPYFPIIVFVLFFILLMVFVFGMDIKFCDLKYYIPSFFGLVSMVIIINRTFTLSHITGIFTNFTKLFGESWIYTMVMLFELTFSLLIIIFPFTGETGYTGFFVLSLGIIASCVYILVMQKKNKDFRVVQITCFVVLLIFTIVAVTLSFFIFENWKLVLLIDSVLLLAVCILYSVTDFYRNNYKSNYVSSGILTAAGLISYAIGIYLVFTEYIFYGEVLSLIGAVGICSLVPIKLYKRIAEIAFQVITLIIYFVKVKDSVASLSIFIYYVDFLCFFYVADSLLNRKKSHTFVFSENFFPVNLYHSGKLERIKGIGPCIAYMFFVPFYLGTVLVTYTTNAELSYFTEAIAYIVPMMLIAYYACPQDRKVLDALLFIKKPTVEYAIKQAMIASSTDFHDNEEKEAFFTYHEFVSYTDNQTNATIQRVLFTEALKGQLQISYETSFDNIVNTIKQYLHLRKAFWDIVDVPRTYSSDNMYELAEIYEIIESNREQANFEQQEIIDKMKEKEEIRHMLHSQAIQQSASMDEYYMRVIEQLQKDGSSYEDTMFVPGKEPEKGDDSLLASVKWLKAETQFTGSFINDKFDPDEVCMGDLDDSYLIAAMISLSKNSSDVTNLFRAPLCQKNSIFMVNFKCCGQDLNSVVDSKLPFQGLQAKFTAPENIAKSSWWYSIVEKAFAKASGGFSNIENGFCHQALSMLVDGIPEMVDLQSEEGRELVGNQIVWNEIVRILKERGHVCASRIIPDDRKRSSYVILNAVDVDGIKLLNLKNPYNVDDWTGPWGKDSELWEQHPDVKAACNACGNSLTTFWMPFNAFVYLFKYLYTLDVQFYNSLYEIKSSFTYNVNDGADPYNESEPTLDTVPNFSIRFKKPTKMKCVLEKSGARTPVKAYLVYNYGKRITRIWRGRDSRFGECSEDKTFDTFEWDVTRIDRPWTLAITRKCIDCDTKYCLRIWADSPIEITQVNLEKTLDDGSTVPMQPVEIKEHQAKL